MTISLTTHDARRGTLSRVCMEAARMLDGGTGYVRVPVPDLDHDEHGEPGATYQVGPLLATVRVADDVYLTMQDTREPECMPLLVETTGDADEAARILAVLVAAITEPDHMWHALDLVAGVHAARRDPLPGPDVDAPEPRASWTDNVWGVLDVATGHPCYPPETGYTGRYLRAVRTLIVPGFPN